MKRLGTLLILTLLLTGCKSTDSLVTQHDTIYKTNIEYRTQFVYDSIKDSTSTNQYTKDSIIYIETYKYKYRYKTLHDTIKVTDTLYKVNDNNSVTTITKKNPLTPFVLGAFLTFCLIGLLVILKHNLKSY